MNINDIRSALEYPGQTIKDSFIFTHNRIYSIDVDYKDINNSDVIINHKHMKYSELFNINNQSYVISYGANAALKYLESKFKNIDIQVPVIYFELEGYDIVYANYICSDGTIPATMVKSDKSSIKLYVSPLLESSIDILNETESIGVDYELCEIEDEKLNFLNANKVYYYRCLHGALNADDKLYSCANIIGENRLGEKLNQYDIIKLACEKIFSELDIFEFISRNIEDKEYRNINNEIMWSRYV